MKLTNQFDLWKEATRNLWNLYFYNGGEADWESHEVFSEIEELLFEQIVLRKINVLRADDVKGKFKLVPKNHGVIVAMVNRSGDGGYWDHPVTHFINDNIVVDFIEYFDWDQLGIKDNRYIMSRIISSKNHPEVNGFKAIIETQYVDIIYEISAQQDDAPEPRT